MKVYHGTIKRSADNIISNGVLLEKSKEKLDFGKGSYTTPSIDYAIKTAHSKNVKAKKDRHLDIFKGTVLEFEYNNSIVTEIKHLTLNYTDLSWAQFIVNNRNGKDYVKATNNNFHNIDLRYDIVSGAIADGRIVALSEFLNLLSDNMAIDEIYQIKYRYDTLQISFHTPKSLDCIDFIRYGIIDSQKGVEWYE